MDHLYAKMDIDMEAVDESLPDVLIEPLTSPAECLARLLHTEEYADVTLILPSTGKHIKVHRLVLAMWSPVFKAMVFGPMQEGDTITLPEDHPEAVKMMINYMYSGNTQLQSVDLAVQVYNLSNKYQLDHLKITCSKYLQTSVTDTSVSQVMNAATLLDDDALINKCTQIIEGSPNNVFSSPSIGMFTSKSLELLLDMDIPVSSEIIIFKGIISWGRSQLELNDEDATPGNLRRKIEHLLPKIRFLAMSQNEIVREVLPEYILTLEEATPILQILNCVQLEIPKICSVIKTPRKRFLVSDLKSCKLYSRLVSQGDEDYTDYREGAERTLLTKIKSKELIFLSHLKYKRNISDNGLLIIRDSTGLEIASVEFDGEEAAFENKVKMFPDQEYSFVLKGIERGAYNYQYKINENALLSGFMETYYEEFVEFFYWK